MSELNIGKVIVDATKTSQVVVNYADTSKPDTSTIISNRSQMTATVDSITTAFEASKTYYYDENGGLSISNEGYGIAGFTDADGVFTSYSIVIEIDETITLTAEEEGDITGEHSGGEGYFVDVYYRVSSPEGSWTLFDEDVEVQGDNTWTATGTVATAGTHDFKAVDSVCSACQAQLDDVVVASGVAFLGKYQFNDGDTSSYNLFFDIKYDADEECFFVAGETRKDNFYSGGVAETAKNNPFVMRVEMDGTVTWCKVVRADTFTLQYSNDFRIYISPNTEKIYVTYNAFHKTTDAKMFRIDKDGANYTESTSIASMRSTMIIGEIGSDIILASESDGYAWIHKIPNNFTGVTNFTRISSNETKGYRWSAGYAIHARLGASDTLYFTGCTEQANIQVAKIATVSYSGGAYNMATMATSVSKNTGKNYPLTYHICNDLLHGTGLTQYNASGTHIYENGTDNINNGTDNVYYRCMKYDSDFYASSRGSTKLTKFNGAFASQWDKTPADAVFISEAIDLGDYVAVAGYTTLNGDFDGNNPSNATINGIIYVINKNGTDI